MIDRTVPSLLGSIPFRQLHREVELGWKDLDAGRLSDVDAEDIKKRGRDRLALRGAQLCAEQGQRQDGS